MKLKQYKNETLVKTLFSSPSLFFATIRFKTCRRWKRTHTTRYVSVWCRFWRMRRNVSKRNGRIDERKGKGGISLPCVDFWEKKELLNSAVVVKFSFILGKLCNKDSSFNNLRKQQKKMVWLSFHFLCVNYNKSSTKSLNSSHINQTLCRSRKLGCVKCFLVSFIIINLVISVYDVQND